MRKKWYLKTWVICLFFIPTILGIASPIFLAFPILGFVFTILQYNYDKELFNKYGSIDTLENKIISLNEEYNQKNESLSNDYSSKNENLENLYKIKLNTLENKYNSLTNKYNSLNNEYNELCTNVILKHYDLSDYDGLTSEECKNKITLLKMQEKELIKSNDAVTVYSDANKSVINNNLKQILRCFNTECDNILMNLSVKNIDNMRGKISKSFESINKIFKVDGLELNKSILELKLEELNLVYTYEIKREQEREYQKEIKAQMIEEEKVRREIEQEKKKIEKDQAQFTNEINKLMKYLQKTSNDTEKQLYIDKVKELEEKLKELEKAKETVLERGANAKAGFVYIISNIGSFGEDVYKIGMTRRLEPMDRIKELSSASVPFEFDVHAMIFSDDAPDLEAKLHKHFQKQSINRVNPRKEFFRVALDEIEQVVKENFNNTVEFTRIPVAKEYRQSLTISQEENTNI
ncbi:DUF4041 domain-containing protein [Clostridium neonatale]|uniref:DUF4041 domain-containing protein n=1 Tax=Clostridium neonatale TaxID=137838 RepID=UPI00374F50B5